MKSKQIILLLVIVLVAMIASLAFMVQKSRQVTTTLPQIDLQSIQLAPKIGGQWETKADTQANIGVEVTPVDISATSSVWTFNIAMNTHSGSLDADLTKVATLSDDVGDSYQPLDWGGDSVGGHHRAGLLSFKPIVPMPKEITITLLGIGGITRTLTWQIK